jgi:hypothetical protein
MRFCRSGKVALGMMLLQIACLYNINAQQTSSPALHSRPTGQSPLQDSSTPSSGKRQISTLPRDVSGAYQFEHLNDSIEIDIEHNKLDGYISQLGDAETDSNTPLTFFFDRSAINGGQIEFETRVVHGVWYSFRGTIVRGAAKSRAEEGYYVLQGTLIEHHPQGGEQGKSADETIAKRMVNFKSLGQ